MSGTHKYPTISFRISPREREEIEAKIFTSGMKKKDYFVRSCIYNRVCVVGKKETVAVARSVLLVGRVEGEANIRAVVQIKNNLAAFGHPKAFEFSEDGFHWLGDYEITADEVLGGIAPKANKLEQAKRLLREVAETNNAMQSNEIFNLAEEQGISRRTLENAKKELSIRAKRINNSWYWELDKIKPE